MARARNIKPSFFTNDELAELPALGRLLFIALWTMADREGRLEDRPKRIKAEALPYDECDADALLSALAERAFIVRYEVDGARFIQVVNFAKHQNPHVKEAPSSIPAPDKHSASTVQAQCSPQREPERAGLIPDSGFLIPEKAASNESASLPAGRKKTAVALQTWLEQCRVAGEKAISDYEPIRNYVEKSRVPWEFVQLCWDEFKRRHSPGGGSESKRQADWRKTFLNCVQGNWYGLWWAKAEGDYELTTKGLQAKAVNREAA